MKKQKVITLISLVITIIVLLILVGLSISLVVGENGVLNKTSTSVVKIIETEEVGMNSSGKTTVASSMHKSQVKKTLLSQITPERYGDYVNYEVDLGIATAEDNELSDGKAPLTDWRIFYKDTNNVFLIASDYLPASKFPSGVFENNNGKYNGYWSSSGDNLTTSGTVTSNNSFLFTELSNVTTTNKNYQAVSTLLDTNKWSGFAKSEYVDDVNTAVIGSPTVEMWMASWNEKYKDTLLFNANEKGYQVGLSSDSLSTYISSSDMKEKDGWKDTLYYPHVSDSSNWNSCHGYSLASPSAGCSCALLNVSCGCGVVLCEVSSGSGVRPVVSLKSGITATKDANDVWQLGE